MVFRLFCYNVGMDINVIRQKITPILKQYNVTRASVFGSVARGEDRPNSDIDLLVKVGSLPFGIWGFVGLKQDLEEVLQKKVDVISEGALNPKLGAKIKNDLTRIYDA